MGDEFKEQIHKLVNSELVKQAAGFLEMALTHFNMNPQGLLVPNEEPKSDYAAWKAQYLNKGQSAPGPDYSGYAPNPFAKSPKSMWDVSKEMAPPSMFTEEMLLATIEKLKEAGPAKPYTATQALADIQAAKQSDANKQISHAAKMALMELTASEFAKIIEMLGPEIEKKTGISEMQTGFYGKGIMESQLELEKELKEFPVKDHITGKHYDLVIADDVPIKLPDGQQVPAGIAKQGDIYPGKVIFLSDEDAKHYSFEAAKNMLIPKIQPLKMKEQLTAKELDLLGVVAFEIAHEMYKLDQANDSIKLECGIVVTQEIIEDPIFKMSCQHALTKHTLKTEQAKKIVNFVKKSPGELDVLQAQLAEALGMSAEDYKKYMVEELPKEPEPVMITQGAFNALFAPGLVKALTMKYATHYGLSPHQAKKVIADAVDSEIEKEFNQAVNQLYSAPTPGSYADKIKKAAAATFSKPQPTFAEQQAEKIKVLETIVAGILLSPRNIKITDESFVVSPSVISDMAKAGFRLVFKKKGKDFHISLE